MSCFGQLKIISYNKSSESKSVVQPLSFSIILDICFGKLSLSFSKHVKVKVLCELGTTIILPPFSIIAKKKNLLFVQEFCHSGRNKFPLTNILQILEPTVTFQEYKLTYYLLFLSLAKEIETSILTLEI